MNDRGKFWMQVLVSALLLVAGLVVILSASYDGGIEKAAIGWIGLVVGYWLR